MSEEKRRDSEPVESIEPENKIETGTRIYLSHDSLFKVFFDKKNVAESFIKENLPAEITKDLDYSALTLSKDSFVDKKLSRCYSDILYHIRFKDKPAYMYFLFEHKSWEPDFPGIQLLKNMTHIWETHLEQHKGIKKLPPIIPLLIYHGESLFKVDTSFISMFDIPDTLKKYIPNLNFELYDVSHMPEENIKGEAELRIILTTFRYIFHPEILSHLKDIFRIFREFSDKVKFNEYLELLLVYLGSNIKNVSFNQLRDSVAEALEEGGAMMSTIFQEALDKGKEIGVKEGEEKNKLKVALNCLIKGMDIRTIAEITDLTIERLELLKTAVQQEKLANL